MWILWRMGDDGNPVEIGRYPDEASAEKAMLDLEARRHKQTYWVEKAD